MGLITKEVLVSISNNYKYYENLGYEIPKYIDDHNRVSIKKGTIILVSINDLFHGSKIKVNCVCDNLGEIFSISFYRYLEKVKPDGKTYCHKCSMKLFGNELGRINRLRDGISFYQWCIDHDRQDLLNRWDYELNKFGPEDISYGANSYIYLICPNNLHNSKKIKLNSFTNGISHPEMEQCNECNSFGYIYVNYLHLWSEKNNENPYDFKRGDSRKVWWKCENNVHEDYFRKIEATIRYGFRCPTCVRERCESFLQEKIRLYLEEICLSYGWELNHEEKCLLKFRNPETNYLLRYDNEVISNYFKLITETNGEHHYNISEFHYNQAQKKNTTPEEELEYIQRKDEYKKQYALSQGYYYLAIPYWTDDDQETWRVMIDEVLSQFFINE
jgi:hypothetical protein